MLALDRISTSGVVLTYEEINPQGMQTFSARMMGNSSSWIGKKAAKLFNYLTPNDSNKQKS
jgi:two-component SAPR family response regulator